MQDVGLREGVWRYPKRVEFRNRCFTGLARLWDHLAFAARMRHKHPILQACITHAGYL